MILAAGEANLISDFKPATNGLTITHLQFVDDTLTFCVAKEDQIKNVVAILRCFKVVSALGLKVSFFKSAIVGISVAEPFLKGLANIM